MNETMQEVRCCCNPDNLIGYVSQDTGEAAGLTLRELNPDGVAFDSNHDADAVRQLPGFQEPSDEPQAAKTWREPKKPKGKPKPKPGPKTWRK